MSERLPQVGEPWTCGFATYECVTGPDTSGWYCWRNTESGRFVVGTHTTMTPPKPTPPEWLADAWVNVYPKAPFTAEIVHASADRADEMSAWNRVGRLRLGDLTWVPCDGKKVLA